MKNDDAAPGSVEAAHQWNRAMVGIKALLSCTEGELECIGESLLDQCITEVNAVYAAMTAYVDPAAPVAAPALSEWVSVADRLPEVRDAAYQVVTCAKKTYGDETNYPGQGINGVNQDWVVRQWPGNFAYWMPLPAAPQVPA